MGRSYWFECAKCGYRAKVSGRADRGLDCFVQTILCRDCRELYDVVARLRVPEASEAGPPPTAPDPGRSPRLLPSRKPGTPPPIQSVLNRLPHQALGRTQWRQFKLQCPVSPLHRVESWNEPARCPRCGLYLEKNALPYRIWE